MNNFENEFRNWAERQKGIKGIYKIETVKNYIRALKEKIPYKLFEIDGRNEESLLKCDNINYLENLYDRLLNGDLRQFNNETANKLPSASVKLYIKFLKEFQSNTQISEKPTQNLSNFPLNQILYGPPGTGKTYKTIDLAVKIIDNQFYQDNKENRKAIKEKFNEYRENGQIEFITFHQSYSYEEFVEGLKAESDESGNIRYEVKDGVFKKMANKAQKSDNFDEIYNKLLEKVGEGKEFFTKTGKKFKVRVNSKDNLTLLTGDNLKEQGVITKNNLKNNNFNYWKSYTLPILDYLKELGLKDEDNSNKPYILIIDEINRGNISKIFGELITLIEPSKRIGADEEIKVQLPYSNEEFGVPKNLYIIGTMNTADRSIALLDTAIRRRFEFIEMIPQAEKLKNVEGIDLEKMLEIINKRIEYLYDKDHTIGHSYFMEVETIQELKEVFLKKIIPLLEEYFYDEYEKIKLVFNNNGFIKKDESYEKLFSSDYNEDKTIYKIDKNSLDDVGNYIKIYEWK